MYFAPRKPYKPGYGDWSARKCDSQFEHGEPDKETRASRWSLPRQRFNFDPGASAQRRGQQQRHWCCHLVSTNAGSWREDTNRVKIDARARAREREREEERETCFVHKQKKATGRKYLRDFERIDFPWSQGGTGVRWARNKKQVLTSPCSNLRSFGSKCTVLKKVLAPFSGLFRCHRWFGARGVAHPLLLLVTPLLGDKVSFCALFSFKILF